MSESTWELGLGKSLGNPTAIMQNSFTTTSSAASTGGYVSIYLIFVLDLQLRLLNTEAIEYDFSSIEWWIGMMDEFRICRYIRINKMHELWRYRTWTLSYG